jgi:DNA-damage-inducible protein D
MATGDPAVPPASPAQPSAPHLSPFEAIRKTNEYGADYWSSRDLARLLGYREYRNFEPVVEKAIAACKGSGINPSDHFVGFHEMIPLGKGGRRAVESFQLSRYACYLVIQNADPTKDIVALGQTYFAVQTRRQELADQADDQGVEDQRRLILRSEMRNHNVQLADAAKDAGVVEAKDYAIFQNHGYRGLYGGLGAREIHGRKGLRRGQEILDHMGSAELAANLFRATQAEQKLRREGITGKANANRAHEAVGRKVRQTIHELGGTMPEDLPAVASIKVLEAKQRAENGVLDDKGESAPGKDEP